jgi:hypothetical protein
MNNEPNSNAFQSEFQEKLQVLKKELDFHFSRLNKARNNNKYKSFTLKLLAVCFAGAITVLLGINVSEDLSASFKNIALILSAVITVLNAYEGFYDHRSLWIQGTVTLSQLAALKNEVDYITAGREQKVSEDDMRRLDDFNKRLEQILQDELKAWLKMRQETSIPGQPAGRTTP